jgi:hypothetical protein
MKTAIKWLLTAVSVLAATPSNAKAADNAVSKSDYKAPSLDLAPAKLIWYTVVS